jgi:replicative DNA helicase
VTRRDDQRDPRKRQLPHSAEAEASILGGVIIANDALSVLPDLEVEDFYDNRHKVVFQAVRNLEAICRPIDVVTLENEITKAGKIDAIGGVAFLGELTLRVPTVDNVESYGAIVKQHRVTRDVMVTLSNMLDEAFYGESEGEQLVHDVTTAMMMIGSRRDEPIVTVAELIAREARQVLADVESRARGELVFAGVPTGVDRIDQVVGGHPIGIPTLYIARPGTAKTTLAMMFARASAVKGGGDTLLASYEDAGQSFGQRGLAQESGLSTELIRARRLTGDDLLGIMAGWASSHARTELLLSASGMSVESLVRRIRRENVRRRAGGKKPLRQVIVDYIQKMPQPEHVRSRDEGIGHISSQLATMAVREELAVVEMCQLNREVEKRDDHQPRVSDIRDSGSLEQDGKFIVGLYRPWNYEPRTYPEHELHLLILKNHQGDNHVDIKMFWDVKSHAVYNTEVEYQQARADRKRAAAERRGGE